MDIGLLAQSQLDTFNYDQALDFLEQYGNASKAQMLRSLSRTSFTDGQIIQELTKLAATPPPSDTSLISESNPPAPTTPTSDHLQTLYERRNQLVREMDHYCGMLELIDSQEERHKTALAIITKEEEWRRVWEEIDHYNEFGTPMPVIPTDKLEKIFYQVTRVSDLMRIQKNYKTYLAPSKRPLMPEPPEFYKSVIVEADRRIREAESHED